MDSLAAFVVYVVLVNDFQDSIRTVTAPADLDTILSHALAARASGTLSRGDYAQIRFQAEQQSNAMKQAGKDAETDGWITLRDRFFAPTSPLEATMKRFLPKLSAPAMKEDYDAALRRHKGDVNAAVKDVNDKYRAVVGGATAGTFGKMSEGAAPTP